MPIPTPKRPSGYFFGSKDAGVQIDCFVDIQCPHSRLAWPNVRSLTEHYTQGEIGLKVHLITLSNHRQSWDITKAIFYLSGTDDARFFECMDFYYARQEEFYNAPFLNKTHADLYQYIKDTAQEFRGKADDNLQAGIDSGEVYEAARTPNRLAAVRGAWGTPTFYINNARQSVIDHSTDLAAWRAVIDPML